MSYLSAHANKSVIYLDQFRSEKKHLSSVKISDDNLKQRLSLGIALLPESEDDKHVAKQMLLYKNLGCKLCFTFKMD